MLSRWPFGTHLELGALPGAVPCARLHARQMLWEWGHDAAAETVELMVSELVTNAQSASAGIMGSRYDGQFIPGVPPIRFWLCADTRRVLIQVWDGDHHLPVRQAVDLEADSGRGLLLMEALSAEWGTFIPEACSGKVVWAVVTPDEKPLGPLRRQGPGPAASSEDSRADPG